MPVNDILVGPSDSILKTMQLIDKNTMQIAIVVDEYNQLLGTVTDGDIRRGILKGLSLDSPIEIIMNTSPKKALIGKPEKLYVNILKRNKLKHLPLTSEEGKFVDLFLLEAKDSSRRNDNIVVLMAGGLGSRLRPLTDEIPKPLLPVGGKPILEHIIESFKENGFYQFLLSVNYKKEYIETHFGDGSELGVEISYLPEEKRLGTAGALSLLTKDTCKPIIVMNGDLLTKVNFEQLLSFHLDNKATATMCVRNYEYQIPYGVINTYQQRLIGIEEKPIHHSFVNAGIYVLNPEVKGQIPYNDYYDMPELFIKLIANNVHAITYMKIAYWMDVGQLRDYEKANDDFDEVK